jgi:hypothetical protein
MLAVPAADGIAITAVRIKEQKNVVIRNLLC